MSSLLNRLVRLCCSSSDEEDGQFNDDMLCSFGNVDARCCTPPYYPFSIFHHKLFPLRTPGNLISAHHCSEHDNPTDNFGPHYPDEVKGEEVQAGPCTGGVSSVEDLRDTRTPCTPSAPTELSECEEGSRYAPHPSRGYVLF